MKRWGQVGIAACIISGLAMFVSWGLAIWVSDGKWGLTGVLCLGLATVTGIVGIPTYLGGCDEERRAQAKAQKVVDLALKQAGWS